MENKMAETGFGKKRFERFVVAASVAAKRINTEREQVLGADVVNKLRQPVAGTGKPTVDDAIRTARKIGRNKLASTFRFLEECGSSVSPARRKPAMRPTKVIRGGAAKKTKKMTATITVKPSVGGVSRVRVVIWNKQEKERMLRFLEEYGLPASPARRKPAIRPTKVIRGGAAKKSRK